LAQALVLERVQELAQVQELVPGRHKQLSTHSPRL
jgi:hypothetical protein